MVMQTGNDGVQLYRGHNLLSKTEIKMFIPPIHPLFYFRKA